jgi:sulfoxide reductase heme-binding subunit YedZ
MEGPILWYLNRGSGAVTLVLFTLTVVLGVLSLGGRPARRVPRFVVQSLHRNAALLAFVMLGAHIVSAVVDEYVDIRWWQAFVPFGAAYEPLWLGLGAVALDLLLVIAATSMLRRRLADRTWRLLHQLAWPMWGLSLAHGIGMGTDLRDAWWLVTLACGVAVVAALVWRLVRPVLAVRRRHRRNPQPEPQSPSVPELKVLR